MKGGCDDGLGRKKKKVYIALSLHQIDSKMSKAASTSKVLVKLLVPAGKASAQPPVGPALGAKGVKAMDFAKEFNARTAHLDPGLPTPCEVTINPDRTFSFVTKCQLRLEQEMSREEWPMNRLLTLSLSLSLCSDG